MFHSDIVCTGCHATELGRVQEGQAVAVWGCGPMGLVAQEWARYRGAAQVMAIDRIPTRLELAAGRGGPLERAAEAYEMFDNNEDNAVKVVLTA